uniref:Uncharacterized protein n=1 Tax=Rhizophora mucronata TaxID=61149 RepID=A0A2P2IKM5_RHIMU
MRFRETRTFCRCSLPTLTSLSFADACP